MFGNRKKTKIILGLLRNCEFIAEIICAVDESVDPLLFILDTLWACVLYQIRASVIQRSLKVRGPDITLTAPNRCSEICSDLSQNFKTRVNFRDEFEKHIYFRLLSHLISFRPI